MSVSNHRNSSGINWRDQILHLWKIRHTEISKLETKSYLWTTRCTRTKTIPRGSPRELYHSTMLDEFFGFVDSSGARYGVLSDKYGLHMDDEILDNYDIHPSTLTENDKRTLGTTVGVKARSAGYHSLIFFAHSPLMSKPYFQILSHSGLSTYYVTTLRSPLL